MFIGCSILAIEQTEKNKYLEIKCVHLYIELHTCKAKINWMIRFLSYNIYCDVMRHLCHSYGSFYVHFFLLLFVYFPFRFFGCLSFAVRWHVIICIIEDCCSQNSLSHIPPARSAKIIRITIVSHTHWLLSAKLLRHSLQYNLSLSNKYTVIEEALRSLQTFI